MLHPIGRIGALNRGNLTCACRKLNPHILVCNPVRTEKLVRIEPPILHPVQRIGRAASHVFIGGLHTKLRTNLSSVGGTAPWITQWPSILSFRSGPANLKTELPSCKTCKRLKVVSFPGFVAEV